MTSQTSSKARLFALIGAHLARRSGGELRVLEAGGGAAMRLPPLQHARVTVVDICPDQLAKNGYAHEKICSDLHELDLGEREFDLIVCWNVLEHLRDPARVAAHLASHLAPGGAFVIASPNPLSLAGLVTKFTPHWVHELFHVRLMRTAHPGGSGFRPFRTHIRFAMRADALQRQFARAGLQTIHCEKYDSDRRTRLKQRSPFAGTIHDLALSAGRIATLGHWKAELSDYFLVVVRGANVTELKTEAARPQVRAASM